MNERNGRYLDRGLKRPASRHVFRRITVALIVCLGASLSGCSEDVPAIENEEQLLATLRQKDFEGLSRSLAALNRKYRKNVGLENDVHKSFYVFNRSDRSLEPLLNDWVKNAPKDPYPYLARGIYRSRLGWEKRGGDWASGTTPKEFRGMGYWFKLAKSDLHQALALDDAQIEAYLYLMEIDMNEGGTQSRALFEKALAINPRSLFARWYFTTTLLPRWGGSHDAMQQVISASREFYPGNPRLKVLEGRVHADLGDGKFFAGDYSGAAGLYDKALQHGDFWFYNQQHGECLYYLADYQGAAARFSAVIAEKPGYKRAYWMRAQSHKMLGDYKSALADITQALAIEPEDDAVLAARAYIHWHFGAISLALEDLRSALALRPAHDSYRREIRKLSEFLDTPDS